MITYKQVIEIVSERKVECKTDSQMRAGQAGPLPAKSAGLTAKLRARSKLRPGHKCLLIQLSIYLSLSHLSLSFEITVKYIDDKVTQLCYFKQCC